MRVIAGQAIFINAAVTVITSIANDAFVLNRVFLYNIVVFCRDVLYNGC